MKPKKTKEKTHKPGAGTKKKSVGKKAKLKTSKKVAVKSNPIKELQHLVIPVDTTLYPIDAIYGAAYIFLDRAYVYLERQGDNIVKVVLMSKQPANQAELKRLGGEFTNELLNQSMRAKLDETSRKIREYIVLKSHFSPQEQQMDIDKLLDQTLKETFDEDPLDIAVPWEEKYGKTGNSHQERGNQDNEEEG